MASDDEEAVGPMLTAVRILHAGLASAWFGHKLLIPSDLRASLAGSADVAESLLPRLARAEILGVATGVGTLVTGAF